MLITFNKLNMLSVSVFQVPIRNGWIKHEWGILTGWRKALLVYVAYTWTVYYAGYPQRVTGTCDSYARDQLVMVLLIVKIN